MAIENLVGILAGTTTGNSGPSYISNPEVIRYFDNLLAWQMNHVPNLEQMIVPILNGAVEEAGRLYSSGDISDKEYDGVLQFLDMRRVALENEINRYGNLQSERVAIQPKGEGSLYNLPPEDMWESKKWENWWPKND